MFNGCSNGCSNWISSNWCFIKKEIHFVKVVILTVIGQYTFLFFFLFLIKNVLFIYFDRQRWAAILAEIAKAKEEINNTCRNCKSKRIVWGSKRRIFKVQVLIKEYTITVHNICYYIHKMHESNLTSQLFS